MSAEDVGKALEALDDNDVRGHVMEGDLSDLKHLNLTEHEAELVCGAADDYPEVAGFMFANFVQHGSGSAGLKDHKMNAANPEGLNFIKFEDVSAKYRGYDAAFTYWQAGTKMGKN